MANLQKFEPTEEWRNEFKKHLFMERTTLVKPLKTVKDTNRYSMDVGSELQNLLKERNIPRSREEVQKEREDEHEKKGKENFSHNCRIQINDQNSLDSVDDTVEEPTSQSAEISNASYEIMEKLCDKTDSDSNGDIKCNNTDIGLELKNLLKERNINSPFQNVKKEKEDEHEKKWEKIVSFNRRMQINEQKHFVSVDDTILESERRGGPVKNEISDESFEAMEQMCDKTASDPNSTLFQYLNAKNKREIIEATKKRRSDEAIQQKDPEVEALNKMLNDLGGQNQDQINNESPLRGIEMTQIEDIEAPSRFWDCTVLQTSPVKMVGLLRPSTIIEEGADFSNVSSSAQTTSYKSAVKTLPDEVSSQSSCYETASENASFCKFYTNSNQFNDPQKIENVDIDPLLISDEEFEHANVTQDLIDFEKTMAAANNSIKHAITPLVESKKECTLINLADDNETPSAAAVEEDVKGNESSETESEESIIEILSDEEEEDPLSPFACKKPDFSNNETPRQSTDKTLIKWNTPFRVDNKENVISSPLTTRSLAPPHSQEQNNATESPKGNGSLHFNDTLEEVEYMMKKGMEIMEAENQKVAATESLEGTPKKNPTPFKNQKLAAIVSLGTPKKNQTPIKNQKVAGGTPKKNPTPITLKARQNTFTISSPSKGSKDRINSPLRNVHAYRHGALPKIPSAVKKTPTKPADPFTINIKPLPKFDIFKKPSADCKPPSSSITPRTKDHFSHIISPVGAYVNKTAKAPFITNVRQRKDDHNSSAFRELEYESRLYKPNFSQKDNFKILAPSNGRTLPKKAYISSAYRQVTDERSPVVIPGGNKIQKYLEGAVMPAVIRHDGKAKMCDLGDQLPLKQQQDGNNMSLANLSVMSGDVSVYTIKDAQKL